MKRALSSGKLGPIAEAVHHHPSTRHTARIQKVVERLDCLQALAGRFHEKSAERARILEYTSGIHDDLAELRDLNLELVMMLASKSERIERFVHALVTAGVEVPK